MVSKQPCAKCGVDYLQFSVESHMTCGVCRGKGTAEAQIAQLQQENENLKGDVQHLLDTCVPVVELQEAEAALRAYGQHKPTCAKEQLHMVRGVGNVKYPDELCTCGFAAVLGSPRTEQG